MEQSVNVCSPLTRSYSLYTSTRLSRASNPHDGRPHKRSLSADRASCDDKLQILRRGQPNTIKNGLLKGEQQKLKKLRKSFERPDISGPIPITVQPVSEEAGNVKVKEYFSKEAMLKAASNRMLDASLSNVILPPPNQFADETHSAEYDSDESEAGFSTISGGTVIHVPVVSSSSLKSNASSKSSRSPASNVVSASQYNLHSSNSTDSLLSASSIDSVESTVSSLQRCLSTDSGQGSLLDCTAGTVKSHPEQKESLDVAFIETDSSIQRCPNISLSTGQIANYSANGSFQNMVKKSNSANQLTPVSSRSVVRSQSMYVQTSRRHNIKPNILISADTHKILARAGYLASTPDTNNAQDYKLPVKTPPKSNISDYSFRNGSQLLDCFVQAQDVSSCEADKTSGPAGDENSQVVIKRAQVMIPKHDSIADIQVNQAGKVAENVRQFMDSGSVEVTERHRSPFRFPNSTSRRGVSPIRIPTIFARNDKHAAQLRELALLAKEKSEALKRLQSLSRETVKICRPVGVQQMSVNSVEEPQMASSSCSAGAPVLEKSVSSDSGSSSKSPVTIGLLPVKENNDIAHTENIFKLPDNEISFPDKKVAPRPINKQPLNAVKDIVNDAKSVTFGGTNVDLSSSLIATINEVCTPKSKNLVRSPLAERGNCEADGTTLVTSNLQLRTANGMTPHRIIKFCQLTPKDRRGSPGKPVKRLGSPGSPYRGSAKRNSHSPHKAPSSVLQSVQSHPQTALEEI